MSFFNRLESIGTGVNRLMTIPQRAQQREQEAARLRELERLTGFRERADASAALALEQATRGNIQAVQELAPTVFDFDQRGRDAEVGRQTQLDNARTGNAIATLQTGGQVKQGLIGAEADADVARLGAQRGILGDQHGHEYKMGQMFFGDSPLVQQLLSHTSEQNQNAIAAQERMMQMQNPGGVVGFIRNIAPVALALAALRA